MTVNRPCLSAGEGVECLAFPHERGVLVFSPAICLAGRPTPLTGSFLSVKESICDGGKKLTTLTAVAAAACSVLNSSVVYGFT